MRIHEIICESGLDQEYHEPLIRIVGKNFPDSFLHGTAKKNIKSLAAASRPVSSTKKSTGNILDYITPAEQNEFNAVMFLSDPRQSQQAHMFSTGKGNAMAVVRLKQGTRVLDLSDEATRAPMFSFGGHTIIRFFSRPAITDSMIEWQFGRIHPGYKERYPDWKERVASTMDPTSPNFKISTWQDTLVPYCLAHDIGAIRFAYEILVTDRNVIRDGRLATEDEIASSLGKREWPGTKAGLFTDQKTGAHDEASINEDAPPLPSDSVFYHGSNAEFDIFDPKLSAHGHAQEGPGFYLTSSLSDAKSYGKNVKSYKIHPKRLVSLSKPASKVIALKLIKMSPNLIENLENWDEFPQHALRKALDGIMSQRTEKEVYEQIWFDFYQSDPDKWLEQMVKNGFSGVIIPKSDGVVHFVCYDTSVLIRVS